MSKYETEHTRKRRSYFQVKSVDTGNDCAPGVRLTCDTLHVSGMPIWNGGLTDLPLTPTSLTNRVIHVPGVHWAFRDEYSIDSWFSPELEWLAWFRSECVVFETTGNGWRAERDGYEYHIPARWHFRSVRREVWM